MYLRSAKKSLDVHIFSDQSSLEIFTDQYRNNHSNNIFAGNDQDAISISAFGGRAVIRDYEAYGLQECFKLNQVAERICEYPLDMN